MEKEEGEMSDDNAMIVDDVKESIAEIDDSTAVLYKAEKNGIIIEQLEKVDAAKLEERAVRFGLNLSGSRLITQKQIDELYANCGVESGNQRHFRFDTLHLNGIDGLTTREIFEYLEDYKPVSLEKVDENSCNIVCQDNITAALALLVHSREIKNEEINKSLSEKSHHHWREGMPHPKKDLILMRFGTNGDKKLAKTIKPERKPVDEYNDQIMESSKNPWGDLCKSWGVYDHQEFLQRKLPKTDYEDDIEEPRKIVQIKNKQLAMRLGKRSHKAEESEEDSNSDSEWKKKSKTLRMRMHADDEESRQKTKKQKSESIKDEDNGREWDKDTFAPLSIEVVNTQKSYLPRQTTKLSDKFKTHGNTNSKKDSILSRLGTKVLPTEETVSSDDVLSDNSDHYVMSRVQKVSSIDKSTSSVWSRLETKKNNDRNPKDLRQMLKSKKQKNPDDLRERLGKSKKTNLRIEIDNHYAN